MTEKDKTGDQLVETIRKTKTAATTATTKKTTARRAATTKKKTAPAAESKQETPISAQPSASDENGYRVGRRVWPD